MKEVHDNLGQLRKQYDYYRTQSLTTEKDIQRFKVLFFCTTPLGRKQQAQDRAGLAQEHQ
jgi:hypothetical protein